MFKHGCMALVAIACAAAVPAAHAEGNSFIAAQVGQAKYHDIDFDDDSARTYAISTGYRWQAGAITRIGIEAGYGQVDEVSDTYPQGFSRIGMEASYAHIGANARFNFGEGSRWFAIVRAGYMGYTQDVNYWFAPPEGNTVRDSFKDDGGGAYFGVGLGVDITPSFSINVMRNGYAFSSFDNGDWGDDYGTAATNTLGLELRF